MTQDAGADTDLQGCLLTLARWLVAAYAVAMLVCLAVGLALFPHYAETHLDSDALNSPNYEWTAAQTQAALQQLGWPATTMAWVSLGSGLFGSPIAYLVLFLLLWRGATTWFRIYVAFVCASFVTFSEAFAPIIELVPALAVFHGTLGAIGWQFFFITFYFFPNGRPVPTWAGWLAWFWGGLIVLEVVLHLITGTGLPQAEAVDWLFAGLVFTVIGSQGYRYFWRSDAIERQQIKWVVYALILMALVIGVEILSGFRPADPVQRGPDLIVAMILFCLFRLAFALVFAAIGVAILRYRLWDIDLIIRRTLIYGVLTATLALVYVGCILVSRALVAPLTGGSELAIVVSTLAIAALFLPLRRRIQNVIDRRFYRRKYDAAKVLAAFGATARDETDLERLTGELLRVVDETMQPEFVGLWLPETPVRSMPESASPDSPA